MGRGLCDSFWRWMRRENGGPVLYVKKPRIFVEVVRSSTDRKCTAAEMEAVAPTLGGRRAHRQSTVHYLTRIHGQSSEVFTAHFVEYAAWVVGGFRGYSRGSQSSKSEVVCEQWYVMVVTVRLSDTNKYPVVQ